MSLADLLPSVRVNGAAATRAVQASELYVPPQGMRKRSADTMLITAIDLEKRQIVQTLGISGSAEAVYVSPEQSLPRIEPLRAARCGRHDHDV